MESIVRFIEQQARASATVAKLRMKPAVLNQFAWDLTLVAVGIRTAYLVDVLSPADPVAFFTNLLRKLRHSETEPLRLCFLETVHVYHEPSDQSFLINTRLCRRKDPGITSIIATNPVFKIVVIPDAVLAAFRSLQEALVEAEPTKPFSISIPPEVDTKTMVTLAGVLLDYQGAYIPPKKPLLDIALDFYTAKVVSKIPEKETESTHTFFKFSIPAILSAQHSLLDPPAVARGLDAMFQERLKEVQAEFPSNQSLSINVSHSQTTVAVVSF